MEKDLLVLSGKMASGKSTVANFLKEEKGYEILSISTPIRKTVKTIIEDGENGLYKLMKNFLVQEKDERVKKIVKEMLEIYEEKYKDEKWEKNKDGEYNKTQPFRELMQKIATKLREEYSEDIWTRIAGKVAIDLTEDGKKIVIDDLRLQEEKKILEKIGFISIRLEVDKEFQRERLLKIYGEINEETLNHKTEIDLDNVYFDFKINANKNLEEIKKELESIL